MGPLLSSPRKKYLVLDSPPPFFLGGERPASGFQSEQPSPFSFFFAFSLSSLSPLVVLGESENEIVALCPHSAPSQHRPRGTKDWDWGTAACMPITHMHVHMWTHVHTCTQMCICTHACMDTGMYACRCMWTYVHTCTQNYIQNMYTPHGT